jgi:hypothetical protein
LVGSRTPPVYTAGLVGVRTAVFFVATADELLILAQQ